MIIRIIAFYLDKSISLSITEKYQGTQLTATSSCRDFQSMREAFDHLDYLRKMDYNLDATKETFETYDKMIIGILQEPLK